MIDIDTRIDGTYMHTYTHGSMVHTCIHIHTDRWYIHAYIYTRIDGNINAYTWMTHTYTHIHTQHTYNYYYFILLFHATTYIIDDEEGYYSS